MNNEAIIRKIIANNTKRIRDEKNLTQEEIAYRMGMSDRRVSEIENARSNSTIGTLVKLANALEIDFIELFTQNTNDNESNQYSKQIAAISKRDKEVIDLLLNYFTHN